MLNFIYYPVSAILWFWHKAIGFVFGPSSGVTWALSVMFLVFTLRALLYKPFVHQVRSMRKIQEFQPEIKKLQAKYKNDKQKLATEMQKLQSEHGVNPVGGCLPMFVQIPVFIGLFHVLRGFNPDYPFNYVFGRDEIVSFNDAHIFGAKLGATLFHRGPYINGALPLSAYHTTITQMLVVMAPLMLMASCFTHLTARYSVSRQTEAQRAIPQAAIMAKITMYLLPVGVVIGAPFFPLAILFYWVANNLWTMAQQRAVYKKIDAEETEKVAQKNESQRRLVPETGPKLGPDARQRTPGTKPLPGAQPAPGLSATRKSDPDTERDASGD